MRLKQISWLFKAMGLKSTTNDSNQNKFVSFYKELIKKKIYFQKAENITNSNVLVSLYSILQ